MNRLLIIVILLACNVSAWSQVDTCGCDCNIVEIFTDNTLWYPKLDADQDSFYQDGSGAGFDTDDRDPCAPLTNVGTCDQDGDGYINSVDNCNFFYNTDQANNDADSYGDACDNCDFVDNEDQLNSDSDNLGDACDNCPNNTNEDQTNSDADTLGDACDNCPNLDNEGQEDGDGDNVGDICDNCVSVINTAQINSDADTLGDACDWCDLITDNANLNSDGDSYGDACDNCVSDTNEDQLNSDADTLGDACDNCPNDTNENQLNSDSDNLGDACDNCINVTNEDQLNSDTDTLGNACDNCDLIDNNDQLNSDTDNFGDACDNCINVDNNTQANSDGDSFGNACDNCPNNTNEGQEDADSDGIGDACDCDPPTSAGTLYFSGLEGCSPYDPTIIIGSAASGGIGGSIVYTWQSSLNGSSWNNIADATGQNFDAPSLNSTTYYRRLASRSCGSSVVYSNTATVTVYNSPSPTITGSTSACNSQFTTLGTSESFSSYSWNNGETTPTISVVPGTYIVTVTDANGCQGTDIHTVSSTGDCCANVTNPGNYSVSNADSGCPYNVQINNTQVATGGAGGTVQYRWVYQVCSGLICSGSWITISNQTGSSLILPLVNESRHFRRDAKMSCSGTWVTGRWVIGQYVSNCD